MNTHKKYGNDTNNKLKVLQLGKQYYPHIGGIEVTMQQFAEGIQDSMVSHVLASQDKGPARHTIINGVPVYYAKSWGILASLPISWDLIRYLRKHHSEYDIIHLHMPFPLGDLACLLSGFKGKLVLYWHSDVVRQKKALLFYKPLMNWTLRRADAIAIATQGNIDGSPYVKPFEKKCVRIPFGLRAAWEEKSDRYWAEKETLPAVSHKENPSLHLLFIGRLVYYKGCDVLIAAMEAIKTEFPLELASISLHLVGTGAMESELKKRVARAALNHHIRFLGEVSDSVLEQEIRRCDVLVFPSVANSEAFGLVQLEAMAFGKPVINTSLPTGVPWVSLHKKTGLTIPPNNKKALQKAILWMLKNPGKRCQMGIVARKRIKDEFTQEQMLNRIMKLYQDICPRQDEENP